MVFHQLATKAQALAMKAIGATLSNIEREVVKSCIGTSYNLLIRKVQKLC